MSSSETRGTFFSKQKAPSRSSVAAESSRRSIRSPRRQNESETETVTFSRKAANAGTAADFAATPDSTNPIPADSSFSVSAPSLSEKIRKELPKQKSSPNENWLAGNGHSLTYAGIFLFTLVLYFRPYELIPALSGFHSIALIVAVMTLVIYLPTQITVEGTLTALPIEVKCILFIAAWALLSIPIAKNPSLAWTTFNDTFIKVVLVFIVMVNTLRSEFRIKALMWLGVAVGIMLSVQALDLYQKGEFKTEGYRVSVDFGGMFGNPNDMSIHLVIFIPIALALAAAAKNRLPKIGFFTAVAVMAAGCFVTQSRGAFLGMLAVAGVLVWKLGRRQRIKAMIVAGIVGTATILLAPGNYGLRILSIFVPSLDPVGSSGERTDLLMRSILVTLRNPLGIGIGNFEIVGARNLGTHNAFTQVSSELGWLAFAAYLIILLNPLRKLDVMERRLFAADERSWMYYLAIGVQASIAGYFVSSFFSSVAYHWYVYYPVAYAIGLRRICQIGNEQYRAERPEFNPSMEAQPA